MTVNVLKAMFFVTWLQEPVTSPPGGLPPWTPTPALEATAAEAPLPAPAPVVAGATPAAAAVDGASVEVRPPARRRRFVFAWMLGLTFGVSRWMIPSVTGSTFYGGRLRHERWALGVMLTGTFGMADRYFAGILGVRLHLTALHHFGARGFATIGAGVASFFYVPAVAEVETRVGAKIGAKRRVLLGGQVRLGIDFIDREKVPLPQFGLFTGMSFL